MFIIILKKIIIRIMKIKLMDNNINNNININNNKNNNKNK
jgi:hypothetical protein